LNGPRHHQSFLRAILDSPNDDLPRLVYADFLEESGEADRAEFIRIQCELATVGFSRERRNALESRERELLTKYVEVWKLPIRGHQTFRRGFVDTLWTSANFLLAGDPERISDSTVRTLRITNADQRIDDLAEYRGFANIEHLDLTNNNLSGDYRLRAILGNPHLGKLKGLNLHNNRIWADDVLRLAQSPVARHLTHLDLSGNGIGNDGLRHLLAEPGYANLEELIVRSDGLPEYECITADGLGAYFPGEHLSKLRHFDIAGHRIGETGFAFVCQSAMRCPIQTLSVASNHLGGDGSGFIKAIFEPIGEVPLRAINYGGNELVARDARHLLRWPHLEHMFEFRLTGCEMWDDTREMLLASPHAAKFQLDGETP
jgi:uncharacterized protein (TIGR02996 family)